MQQQQQSMLQQMQQQMQQQMLQMQHLLPAHNRVMTEQQIIAQQQARSRQLDAASNPVTALTPAQLDAAERARAEQAAEQSMLPAQAEASRARAYEQHATMTSGAYGQSQVIRNALLMLHKQIASFEQIVSDRLERHKGACKGFITTDPPTFHNHPQQDSNGFPLDGLPAQQPLLEPNDFVMTVRGFEDYMKTVTDAFYKTVVEFSEFTAKFASHFGVEPLVATGVVEGIAELASKKRRRQDVCNCTHDVCHNSKCKCKAAGRACTPGCSCWQRMGANGQYVCVNRGAPAHRSSASSSYEGESPYPHPHSSIDF